MEQVVMVRPSEQAVPYLRGWRADRGMTQEELAQKAQVARGTIIRAENGAPVNVRTLSRLAKALGLNVNELRTVDPDTR
jgi:transcriptional regulator with XRE-family HTH domain